MNTPVSFEISLLLKEKGFDEITNFSYNSVGIISSISNRNSDGLFISAPNIAEVVMWLYEKHGIWIKVECPENSVNNDWVSYIHKVGKYECLYASHVVNSPTKAYEAAIEYVLKNLI